MLGLQATVASGSFAVLFAKGFIFSGFSGKKYVLNQRGKGLNRPVSGVSPLLFWASRGNANVSLVLRLKQWLCGFRVALFTREEL